MLSIFIYISDSFFQQPNHNVNWWFSERMEPDESYPAHHAVVPHVISTAEPPPYTEVAQNGHISLGHSPAKPPDNPHGNQSETMDSSIVTTNNISQYSADGNSQSTSTYETETELSPNSQETSQEGQLQGPFHPTRQSTPVLGRRQLPPLRRSHSTSDTPNSPLQLESAGPQHRHSVSGVPLALPQSLPPRLRPLSPLFLPEGQDAADGSMQSNEVSDRVENVGPFPVRPGRLPPLQPVVLDQQCRLSTSFDSRNQLQRRRKKKRKRTNSWHGERLDTEINSSIQEVSTLSPVVE